PSANGANGGRPLANGKNGTPPSANGVFREAAVRKRWLRTARRANSSTAGEAAYAIYTTVSFPGGGPTWKQLNNGDVREEDEESVLHRGLPPSLASFPSRASSVRPQGGTAAECA